VGIYINLLLAVFNMLPIPPLDGGRVLSNLLPPSGLSRALDKVEPFGLFIVLGLVVTGILFKVLAGPIDWLQGMLLGLVGVRGY
ncbi:MAG: site-2 protease family protein, partial [Steroidobacteraceae bacterium]